MVDTGVEMSVVSEPVAPLSKKATAIAGVTGEDRSNQAILPTLKMSDGGTPSDSGISIHP